MFLMHVFVIQSLYAQKIKTLTPELNGSYEYSKKESAIWQKTLEQNTKINSGDLEYAMLSNFDKSMIDSLEQTLGPMTQSVGCSWYCGGGPYKVTSSTYLKEIGKSTYIPDNIHDFDLFTAWVADTKNGIIGKKINFHFKPFSPRVNKIIIYNGYMKDIELWKENSRAKTLKLYINKGTYAILELEDVTGSQSFNIDPIQSTDSTKDLILTFEVLDIYKGSKYNYLAISEINFDGMDVHCFAAGTKILMVNHSEKNIEEIQKGDSILSFNIISNQFETFTVAQLITASHSNLVKLIFSDNEIIVTDDHPFYTGNNQWSSVNSQKSNTDYVQSGFIQPLEIWDKVFIPARNEYSILKKIILMKDTRLTYSIELTKGENFIANGFLVKTEVIKR